MKNYYLFVKFFLSFSTNLLSNLTLFDYFLGSSISDVCISSEYAQVSRASSRAIVFDISPLPRNGAYAPRFKSSTFMGVVFAETVRDKPT